METADGKSWIIKEPVSGKVWDGYSGTRIVLWRQHNGTGQQFFPVHLHT